MLFAQSRKDREDVLKRKVCEIQRREAQDTFRNQDEMNFARTYGVQEWGRIGFYFDRTLKKTFTVWT